MSLSEKCAIRYVEFVVCLLLPAARQRPEAPVCSQWEFLETSAALDFYFVVFNAGVAAVDVTRVPGGQMHAFMLRTDAA